MSRVLLKASITGMTIGVVLAGTGVGADETQSLAPKDDVIIVTEPYKSINTDLTLLNGDSQKSPENNTTIVPPDPTNPSVISPSTDGNGEQVTPVPIPNPSNPTIPTEPTLPAPGEGTDGKVLPTPIPDPTPIPSPSEPSVQPTPTPSGQSEPNSEPDPNTNPPEPVPSEPKTADQAQRQGKSQVGTLSTITGQTVQPINEPILTNTGSVIASTQNGQIILNDGSAVAPEVIGGVTNTDNTITITKADGTKATLPHTGDSATGLLSFAGIFLLGITGFIKKRWI
ncbi:LPXTG cell wall anchor domain-containing protein [Streptococcus ovis]|uniref:LPXTG cell wall anchor domain-containing protein n=1 Tax=Streptococcus ovis TaxID=82806 RepID=UPI000366B4D2|nr:LPXTG cell wall anchor domain-containing protein [Streptococcus ovis]